MLRSSQPPSFVMPDATSCLQPLPAIPVPASRSLNVLVIADSPRAADVVLSALQATDRCLTWHLAPTLADYHRWLATRPWDAVLACQLPAAGADPLRFPLQVVEPLQRLNPMPTAILWTSPLGDHAAIACLQAGFADYVLDTYTAKLAPLLWQAYERVHQQSQAWREYHLGRLVAATQAAGSNSQAGITALLQSLQTSLNLDRCLLLQLNGEDLPTITHLVSRDAENPAIALGLTCPLVYDVRTRLAAGEVLAWSEAPSDLSPLSHETWQRAGIRALVLCPLPEPLRPGRILALHDCQGPRVWQPAELALLTAAADQAAQLLQIDHWRQQRQEHQQQVASAQQFAQLERENRIKSELLATMSHELRAPLTGILGFARMLQEQIYGALNTKQVQYINAIASSGEYLLALIEDLLDLSRIEAQREELYMETLVVEDVCLASLAIVQSQAEIQGLELTLEIAPEVTICYADQRRLKQILINLLSNAIKFTERGSVTLAVDQAEAQLRFAVRDTGIGIDPADCDRLFRPFCQIHNRLQRKHKGTGLGLALSRELARLHGGDIKVESKPGRGSTFTLFLPLLPRD